MNKVNRFIGYGLENVDEKNEIDMNDEDLTNLNVERDIINENVNEKQKELDEIENYNIEADIVKSGLEDLVVVMEGILKTGTASNSTSKLINNSLSKLINNSLSNLLTGTGIESKIVSLESISDPVEYHIASLESVKSILADLFQAKMVRTGSAIRAISDLIRSYEKSAVLFKKELTDKENKFKGKKLAKNIQTMKNMGFQEHFFRKGISGGEPDFKHDLEVSNYIIGEFADDVIASIRNLTSIVKSSDNTSYQTLEKTLLSKLNTFKNPSVNFKRKYIGKETETSYFQNRSFELIPYKPIKTSLQKHSNLAQIASSGVITHVQSFTGVGDAMKTGNTKDFYDVWEISNEDISNYFKYGYEYVTLIETASKKIAEVEKLIQESYMAIISKLTKRQSQNEVLDSESNDLLKLTEDLHNCLEDAFLKTVKSEARRCLMTLRAINYLTTWAVRRAE